MKPGLSNIVGKTISSIIVADCKSDPRHQVFLVFSDGTYFEFYGESFNCNDGLCDGDAIQYVENIGTRVTHVYPENQMKETPNDSSMKSQPLSPGLSREEIHEALNEVDQMIKEGSLIPESQQKKEK